MKTPKTGLFAGRKNDRPVSAGTSPHSVGRAGEEAALKHLKKCRYEIVAHGYRFQRGEIDIIAYDKDTLVFIEVKSRRSHEFGFPEEALTPAKQAQLRRVAAGFCALQRIEGRECRFDVITVTYGKAEVTLDHIKNAF